MREKGLKVKRSRALVPSVIILLIILSMVSVYPAFAPPAGTGNVHGTILDEEGDPFKGVKVMAYSSTGSLEATKYTDKEGFFRFALEEGKYTIHFEYEGYATEKYSIDVPAGYFVSSASDSVKMGEIVMRLSLGLSASVLSRVVTPGETVVFPFTVIVLGDEAEDIRFSVVSSDDWETRVLDASGEIELVRLSEGSISLDLEVAVPKTALTVEIISLTVVGSSNVTLEFSVFPRTFITQEIELRSTYLSVSKELGRSISLPLTITNEGDVGEIVELVAVGPSDWSIDLVTGSDMAVTRLYLMSGQSETLTMEIVPSDDAEIGDYSLDVNAITEEGVLLDSLELKVSLREATSDVEIISTFTDVTAEAGQTISFPIAIWNKGDTDALFLLTVPSAPENWKTVFTSEQIEISSVLVTAGESLTMKLEVTPPSAVETGVYPINVYMESDDGLITKQIGIRVNIVGSYEVDVELSTLYSTITIGDSVEFSVVVRNRGQSSITTVYLETVVPGDWEITVTPSQVSSLSPRDSATFILVAETPADTVAGDYLITVQALSDQVESDEVDLRVTAKASTSWGFIGIGLAGVAIIGLVIAFTRFKRR
jgi:uncharacterized repeat protein (TIGR01451 family)